MQVFTRALNRVRFGSCVWQKWEQKMPPGGWSATLPLPDYGWVASHPGINQQADIVSIPDSLPSRIP